jgi:hypothetical protein
VGEYNQAPGFYGILHKCFSRWIQYVTLLGIYVSLVVLWLMGNLYSLLLIFSSMPYASIDKVHLFKWSLENIFIKISTALQALISGR